MLRTARRLAATVVGVAAIAGLGVMSAVPASAAVIQNDMVDITNTSAVGGCINDTITTEGRVHVLVTETTDASGGTHRHVKYQTVVLKGVGLTGTEYITNGNNPGINFVDQLTQDTTGAYVSTGSATANIISRGSGINFRVTLYGTTVIRPDGSVAHSTFSLELSCQG